MQTTVATPVSASKSEKCSKSAAKLLLERYAQFLSRLTGEQHTVREAVAITSLSLSFCMLLCSSLVMLPFTLAWFILSGYQLRKGGDK